MPEKQHSLFGSQTFLHLAGIVFSLCVFNTSTYGQSFTELNSSNHGIYNGNIVMADLNRNDTLDIVLIGVDSLGMDVLKILHINIDGQVSFAKQIDIPTLKNPKIQVTDINNNGLIDLLISGTTGGNPYFDILLNKGDFIFEKYIDELPQLNGELLINDFTNNGSSDLIISDNRLNNTDTAAFYLNKKATLTFCDTCRINPLTELKLLGIDNSSDGFTDFIVSGTDTTGLQQSLLYENSHNIKFDITNLNLGNMQNLVLAKGDYTENSLMDVVMAGTINGRDTLLIFNNTGTGFEIENSFSLNDKIKQILTADFTNDGLLDILLVAGDEVILYYANGNNSFDQEIITSSITNESIAMGDFDRDYDQDFIITGQEGGTNILKVFRNENSENKTPSHPGLLFSFPNSDSVILIWNNGYDSTTNNSSLTYNVKVLGPDGSVFPEHTFTHRSLSGYGLQFQTNKMILEDLAPGKYLWHVEAVDNSLVSSVCTGICTGGGPGFCGDSGFWAFEIVDTEDNDNDYEVCKGDTIKIAMTPPDSVQWYSENRGILEFTDTLTYIVNEDDVVYANYCNADGYMETFFANILVAIMDLELFLDNEEVCLGESISFDISDDFIEATWYLKNHNKLITGTTITIVPEQTDSLFVEATAKAGCVLTDSLIIVVNELPEIDAGQDVSIFKGESVQLQATGGITYIWSPASGLDTDTGSTPIASPAVTTVYNVVGTDSAGCSANNVVVIKVRQTVFIPNLFSPNNDGHNDTFKVFGSHLKSISLRVYDAQGKLLYETSNIPEAMNVGWDGTYLGKNMPQGDYLWAISGKFSDESEVSFDGKVTGIITLIR